ncbi:MULTISPECIES: hypothetical protein [unclassified Shewanella]|uniref:hypothetical protein n=1 Tax=unclassified Shewanella TaxID=196818 RepID=UPI001BBAA71B|nr:MULTISPECIES: hypothetical protein [unclassified Shewanella]GIU13517.1 hypothetical protein TUM4444_22080 [Shewanella sp. MBTL60-112-B1]GIU27993.1 hypothetical protein TUM4445_08720 [Shewanella sp. MBTL60-112-B2]
MEFTIYLNDRPYRLLDVGEGECQLMIVDAKEAGSLYELGLFDPSESRRAVILDTSLAWASDLAALPCRHIAKIVEDVHLLIDVYWLDRLRICQPQSNNELYQALKQLLNERLLE